MAQLAAQQQALNGQSGGMLPLMPLGGEGLLQDLRALAERQRRVGGRRARVKAGGQGAGGGGGTARSPDHRAPGAAVPPAVGSGAHAAGRGGRRAERAHQPDGASGERAPSAGAPARRGRQRPQVSLPDVGAVAAALSRRAAADPRLLPAAERGPPVMRRPGRSNAEGVEHAENAEVNLVTAPRETINRLCVLCALCVLCVGTSAPRRALAQAESRVLAEAGGLERLGRHADDAARYRGILRAEPTSVPALLGLERVFTSLERLDSLVPLVRAALARDALNQTIHSLELRGWFWLGHSDSVTAAARRWIALAPRRPDPYREGAFAVAQRGDLAGAKRALSEGASRLGDAALAQDLAQLTTLAGEWTEAARQWGAVGRWCAGPPRWRRRRPGAWRAGRPSHVTRC